MSDLKTVTKILEHGCFCHNSELKYMFECMPSSISHRELASDCERVYCYHKQEKEIKRTLQEFKKFMETKSKFKVGDRVEIAETPVINEKECWGWLSSKHFLIEGAKATISEISYYNNDFGYLVIFDDESWKDQQGVIHPVSEKSRYHFWERDLRSVGSRLSSCEFLKKLWSDFYRIGD